MKATVDELLACNEEGMRLLSRDKTRQILKDLGASKSPPWEKDKLYSIIYAIATALKGAPTDLSEIGGLGISIPDELFRGEKAKDTPPTPKPSPLPPAAAPEEKAYASASTPAAAPSAAPRPAGTPATPATPGEAGLLGAGQETPEQKQARLFEEERRRKIQQERIKKSQEKRRCQVCGNQARSSCPFRSCKSCCAKANNQCQIHVLNTPKPFGSSPGGGGPSPQQPGSSGAVAASSMAALAAARAAADNTAAQALRGAQFRHISGTFVTPADKVRNLREAVEKYQQEVAETVAWRERTYREGDRAEEDLRDEALGRYLRNCGMLEELMFSPLDPGIEARAKGAVEDARVRAEAAAKKAAENVAGGPRARRAEAMADEARERMARFESALDQAYAAGSRGDVEEAARAYCEAFGRRPLPPLPEAPPAKWRRKEKPVSEMPLPPALLAELQGQPRSVVNQKLAQMGIDPASVRLPWEVEAAAAAKAEQEAAAAAAAAAAAGAEEVGTGGGEAAQGAQATGGATEPAADAGGGGGEGGQEGSAAGPKDGGEGSGEAAAMEEDGAAVEGKSDEPGVPKGEERRQDDYAMEEEDGAEGGVSVGAVQEGGTHEEEEGRAAAGKEEEEEEADEEWELEPLEPEELVSVLSAAVVRRVTPEELTASSDLMQARTVVML